MKISKSIKHAFNMVIHSKLRSWLTILGIVIGIASVIAISAMSNGMTSSIDDQLDDLGADVLTLTAGASKAMGMGPGRNNNNVGLGDSSNSDDPVLDKKDIQTLKMISEIKSINTVISGKVDVEYMSSTGSVTVTGVDSLTWSEFITTDLSEGRLLSSSDSNVVVIGGRLASEYFDREVVVNKVLLIEDKSFKVIGILDDSSNAIYMPIQSAYTVIENSVKDEYDLISIIIEEESLENIDNVTTKIEEKLMNARHVTSKDIDFSLSSSSSMNEMRTEMMSTLSIFLTGIAAISLIVGAVGVANSMFTSVLEKTKDIGIMKAIGAKNKDIMTIFLLNSALIGLVGGIFGVIFGIIASSGLSYFISDMPMLRGGGLVSLDIILIALLVAISSGIIAGLIPAYQASKLKPVDALRSD